MTNIIPLHSDTNQITTTQEQLLASADQTIKKAQNPNTIRAYRTDIEQFATFYAEIYKAELFEQNTLNLIRAITPVQLIAYISHLNTKGFKYNSIIRKVAAISKLHKVQNLPTPRTANVGDYLKSIKVEQSKKGISEKQAKAITADQLEKVIMSMDVSTNKGKRDKAILLCCFVGCLRRSEIANVCHSDGEGVKAYIEKDTDGFFIHLNESKRGKTKEDNTSRFIPYSSNPLLCPVRALKVWLSASKSCTGHLFVTVAKGDKIKCDAPICGQTVYNIVKKYFGKKYSGHSLRVGSAVTARQNGADMESIRILGGWKTNQQPQRYTKQTDIKRNSASYKLGL